MKSAVLALLVTSCAGHLANLRQAPTQLQAGADGGKDKQGPARRVSMQIPENEMQEFLSKLSPECEKQYTHMLNGHETGVDGFGGPNGEATDESCRALNGTLCDTMANVAQKSQNASGRTMSQNVDVTGKGCLPTACISGADLAVLANFMRSKAKSSGTIAGQGVRFNLHVDCTKNGGSVADSPEEQKEESSEKHEEHHEDEHHEEKEGHHEEGSEKHDDAEADAHGHSDAKGDDSHKVEAKSFAARHAAGVLLSTTSVFHLLVWAC